MNRIIVFSLLTCILFISTIVIIQNTTDKNDDIGDIFAIIIGVPMLSIVYGILPLIFISIAEYTNFTKTSEVLLSLQIILSIIMAINFYRGRKTKKH
jgi:hypothetical protein